MPEPSSPLAHLVQCDSAWQDKPETFRRIDDMLAAHDLPPGGLIVLPEMFDTGFSFDLPVTADTDGTTLAFVTNLAKRTGCTVHGARTVLTPQGRGLNRSTIVAADGRVLCEYDKVHPFSFGKESQFFDGGTKVKLYDWASAAGPISVCPTICYDLRFPELFRAGAVLGAELFVVPANWPAVRQMHRITLARARAIENQAIVLCLNRAGYDPHLVYGGCTVAFDAKGESLGELGAEPGILSIPIDIAAVRKWRADFPALRDRRDELYARWRSGR